MCLPVGGAYHLYVDVCVVLATRANGNDRGGGVSSRYVLLMTRICILPQCRWEVQVHLLYFSGFYTVMRLATSYSEAHKINNGNPTL